MATLKKAAEKEEAHLKIVLGGMMIKTISVLGNTNEKLALEFGNIMHMMCNKDKDFDKAFAYLKNQIKEKQDGYLELYEKLTKKDDPKPAK